MSIYSVKYIRVEIYKALNNFALKIQNVSNSIQTDLNLKNDCMDGRYHFKWVFEILQSIVIIDFASALMPMVEKKVYAK